MDANELDSTMRHPRCIVHIDVDCFYAQVEMLRHPEYDGKPLGVQQKNIVVTSNYRAREYGIKKCMSVQEALHLCPGLALVRGEDLTPYRQYSSKISEILLQFTPMVERLGLDESFIDVTSMVEKRLNSSDCSDIDRMSNSVDEGSDCEGIGPDCHVFGSCEEECPCGCHSRLIMASRIAGEMRARIYKELGLTCSSGIAHNKLLAKLSGSLNKPNQQTLIFPCSASTLLSTIGSVSRIPGVGQKMTELLASRDIRTVQDLRRIPLENLELKIGMELGRKLKDLAEGIDESVVKPSGKPQSIGLEDGFKSVSLVAEVESRLGALLRRLTELAMEDGRIPLAMKITVRKHDFNKPSSGKRETRQCALPKHSLPSSKGGVYDYAKMLSLAMKLFHRAVDVSKPFHLTLLGVAFTKFEERTSGRSSITSFLRKQVAVQSVLDISSEEGISDVSLGSPMSINQDSNDASDVSQSNSSFGCAGSPGCKVSGYEDDAPGEVEPSPKKTKLEVWLSGRRESPSSEMAGLRLGPSSPSSKDATSGIGNTTTTTTTAAAVLKPLPIDLQRDMGRPWPSSNKPKPNNILKYFIANK